MAKPVGPACNMECSYCYYLETERLYTHPHRFRMSDALLETYVRQYIAASPGPIVLFVWHGGEPTLAGLDFYRRAVELQKRYLPQCPSTDVFKPLKDQRQRTKTQSCAETGRDDVKPKRNWILKLRLDLGGDQLAVEAQSRVHVIPPESRDVAPLLEVRVDLPQQG